MASLEREYERTHPFIAFKVDLSDCDDRQLWMLFGEAKSKCEHINGAPLHPDTAREVNQVYLTKGAHGTTSIEGNTLSEEQVRQIVDGQLKLPKSREYQAKEVENIVQAYGVIVDDILESRPMSVTPERVKTFNAMVLDGLEVEDGVTPGACRAHAVGVLGYRAAPAEDCEYLLERMCSWLEELLEGIEPKNDLSTRFVHTVLIAVLAHLYLAWIHPFGDGNGRTARLLEFQILVSSGLISVPAAHVLSDHYNLTRDKYYRELDRAGRSGGKLGHLLMYALQGFVDGLAQQIDRIRQQQLEVTWQNYVHDLFKGKETPAKSRRRRLALALPDDWVNRSEILEISPRTAADYATKGPKTLSRDLNELKKMHLVIIHKEFVLANRYLIEAFLPLRAKSTVEDDQPPRTRLLYGARS